MVRNRRFRRGIYLLPTLFTVGNIFCGYWSLIQTYRGALELGGRADHRRRRSSTAWTGGSPASPGRPPTSAWSSTPWPTWSRSGSRPALLAYQWALAPLGRTGWLVAFLFVVCAAMRLARFNLQVGTADRRFFAGLPSPMRRGRAGLRDLRRSRTAGRAPLALRAGRRRWSVRAGPADDQPAALLRVQGLRSAQPPLLHLRAAAGRRAGRDRRLPEGHAAAACPSPTCSPPRRIYAWSLVRRLRSHRGAWARDAGDEPEVADESPLR